MRKFIILAVLSLIYSCEMYIDENNAEIVKKAILEFNKDIIYKADNPYDEYWQTYEETNRYKTGDCEDYVIYCAKKIYAKYKIKTNLIALPDRKHAVLEYNGYYFECTNPESSKIEKADLNSDNKKTYLFDSFDYEIPRHRW